MTFIIIRIIKKTFFIQNIKYYFYYLFFTFFSQTISVISSISINYFITRFKDLIFIGIFFFIGCFLNLKKQKNELLFINTLIIGFFLNIFFQLMIIFYPNFFINKASYLFYSGYLDLIIANIQRGRIYFDSFEEILIPIIFLNTKIENDKRIKFFYFVYLFLISFISLVSNFRTKFFMMIFALIASIIIFRNYLKKYLFLIFTLFFTFFLIIFYFIPQKQGYSLIDRFIFIDEVRDILPIISRKEQILQSIDIGLSSPFFGIGLNNFPFYVNINKHNQIFIDKSFNALKEGAIIPHNIFALNFAETGIFGVFSLLVVLFYFVKNDFIFFKKQSMIKKSLIISFWTLFIYALFNPPISFSFNILFWGLRIFLI